MTTNHLFRKKEKKGKNEIERTNDFSAEINFRTTSATNKFVTLTYRARFPLFERVRIVGKKNKICADDFYLWNSFACIAKPLKLLLVIFISRCKFNVCFYKESMLSLNDILTK